MIDLALVMPDGKELSYGPLDYGDAVPAEGEMIRFERSDPEGKLVPDEHGVEGKWFRVLGRQWVIRERGGLTPRRVTFVILRLGDVE